MTAATNVCIHGHSKTEGMDCRTCKRERGVAYKKRLSPEVTAWRALRDNAVKKGLIVDFSFEEFLALRTKPCHYCGDEFERGRASYSLDRKDNTQGYLFENVVVCCYRCNHAKSTDSAEEFIHMCHKISDRFPRKIL